MAQISLEVVLAVVISLITLNLLFIGFYIVSVLRELKKTVQRAHSVIDEVDRTVKDGIDKVNAMERPLKALATTTAAFGSVMKGAVAVRKATQSIISGNQSESDNVNDTDSTDEKVDSTNKSKEVKQKRPRFFRK